MVAKGWQFSVLSLILLTAAVWGKTAQAPEPTAGVAPAATSRAPSAKLDIKYANGQLTIKAEEVPLIDVLRSTCKRIGAELDAQAKPIDPVSGTYGPGAPKEILDGLLADAHVNYAIGGRNEDPNLVASVKIFARTDEHVASTGGSEEQSKDTQDASESTAPARSGASQLLELIEAAKPELSSGVTLDQNLVGETEGGNKVDVAAVVQQLEQQLKSGQAASNTSQGQATDSANSDGSGINSTVVNPTHRPMHRKHH